MSSRLVVAIASSPSASALALCRAALTPARGYALLPLCAGDPDGELARADSIVVCGWEEDSAAPAALLDSLRSAHARGARLCAIGGGALLLAAAGLLDGRRAATSPVRAAALARDYPDVDVRPDALLIDAGGLLTASDDGARELLLRMVERDHGAAAAAPLRAAWAGWTTSAPAEPGLPALLAYLRAHPSQAWDEAALAARAGLPAPELRRRFNEATGMAPEAWLACERAALLRRLLQE